MLEFRGIDRAAVASDADGGTLLARNNMRLEAESFNSLTNPGDIRRSRLGLHHDKHASESSCLLA